ncbi:5-bromo-4-chloroindolyl phosphate hydrolysis family protein [Bacillus sp. T33-2]|uniref:5-bromo-4-chloroindolyl phosphate hydrolysis family protein n=1 Tax=Bacillus sp. T33-2 TaxID=2054168 RepID=UPI000C7916D7|nr:5-bromo-4-chloroindolyl phosphate hydrolysis family protein [Bacillus sp. T33-2]PLR95983.1 protein xpaC [Bacillus sp. T33-2]
MNPFIRFFIGTFAATPIAVSVWLTSFFALDYSILVSSAFSVSSGLLTYFFSSFMMKQRFLRKHQLTRKEYKYIKNNLDEAKRKLNRLNRAVFSIRHIPSLKQRVDLIRTTKKIYKLTKQQPKRFYKAERFYFSHLDSVLELSEKYVFLSRQLKQHREVEQSLRDTRRTLEELTRTVEKDLYTMLSDDIENLNFEIDVAKHSIKRVADHRKTVPVNVEKAPDSSIHALPGPRHSIRTHKDTNLEINIGEHVIHRPRESDALDESRRLN